MVEISFLLPFKHNCHLSFHQGMTVRRVTYTADDVNGFVANVERTNRPIAPPPNGNNPFTIITQ